jgi:ankyrin repeat protein
MLESLKKEAKRWLKALRADDRDAHARFARVHPNAAAAPTLRDVQFALARERGFAGWTELKAAAETTPRDPARVKRTQWFLENACPDHHVRTRPSHVRAEATAMRLLSIDPELAHDTFCTEVVCGNLAEVERVLSGRPVAASTPCEIADLARQEAAGDDWLKDLGPKGWPPLLYLCSTRLPLPAVTEHSVAIATRLLDAGADPNVFFMAGGSKYTPLVAAIGEGEEARPPHPRRDELVRLLLDRGAEPYDIQVIYNIHFRGDVLWFLRSIYERAVALGRQRDWEDGVWRMLDMGGYGSGARWHLDLAIRDNNVELAEWCLAHGASPNAPPPPAKALSKRSLYEEAQRRGESEMLRLLERYGAEVPATDVRQPDLPVSDAMFAAAKRNDVSALRALLDTGTSPDTAASDNTRALHIAARADAVEAMQLLIDRGAEIDPVETTWGGTPIGTATYCGSTRAIDLLSRYSREVFALTFNGKVERVRALLEADPSLARTTPDGDSLLLSLPRDDEQRAIAIARLLLEHGADPSVKDSTGKTPAKRAERLAMFDLARLLKFENP